MSSLFIIPARGGSKGIPRKNIKKLCGRPLIAYTIEAARKVASDDRHIILSTDDDEIAEVARSLGLKVNYRRPDILATDTTGSREVVLDAMNWADKENINYSNVVLLQPTSPLRTAEDISNAIALYHSDIDMVVSVMPAACNPYYDCFEASAPDGYLHVSKGNGLYTRRQDAPKVWQYNGAVYVINPESIRKIPLGAFPRRIPYEMPRNRSIDLDTPTDWIIAETMMNEIIKAENI